MRAEGQAHIERIEAALALVRQSLDWDRALRRLEELDARVQDPTLWDDPKQAQAITQEQKRLETAINTVREIESEMGDAVEFVDMGEAEGDAEVEREGLDTLSRLAERADRDKVQALLSGEADGADTYLQINAGAGGTESQDWAEMLLRMYARWAERRGFKVETVEYAAGDQAGIKSATLLIKGENAYGYAKTESGVHRLVRISPFDSAAKRHTSFSSVWVYPVIDDDIDIEINPSDLKIDTYRASGAGGQHINKTDSAVRLTHIPTGIVVQCQDGRSQHGNRDVAWKRLRSKLYDFELRKQQEEQQKLEDTKTDVGWGHQIRSYVLDNSRIKDLRTNVEISATQKVLDGDLDPFIEASLKQGI